MPDAVRPVIDYLPFSLFTFVSLLAILRLLAYGTGRVTFILIKIACTLLKTMRFTASHSHRFDVGRRFRNMQEADIISMNIYRISPRLSIWDYQRRFVSPLAAMSFTVILEGVSAVRRSIMLCVMTKPFHRWRGMQQIILNYVKSLLAPVLQGCCRIH